MNSSRLKYKLFIFSWAMAALWLSAGSLVNFHQWKIWGKPLLPQAVMSKREQEISAKTLDILKYSKDSDPGKSFSPDYFALLTGRDGSIDPVWLMSFVPGGYFTFPGTPEASGTAPRGPPQA